MTDFRVFIVEDEAIVANDIAETLRSLGYGIAGIVKSGEIAIEKVSETKPDLVLMDIHLAGNMDGIQTAGELHKTNDIMIIYLTAYSDKALLDRAKLTEPYGYVIKPYNERELQSVIEMARYKFAMDKKLMESEEKYRALTENTNDVVFSTDMTGTFTYISPQVNKYGFLADEVIGKTLRDFIHPEDINPFEHNLARDLEKGAQFHSTFRILDKWGNVHWLDEKGTLRLDQSGKPVGIYGVLRDDSERKRAEDALTELKNLYMAIFDNTGSAMIISANDTSILLANPGWAGITGIAMEDCIGRSWTEVVHSDDLETMKKYHYVRREDPSNVPREYSFRLIDTSKNIHYCLVSVVMIPGTTNSVAAVTDISDRKQAEDAIELANKKLNLMNNITRHDILNTITGLLGCVDMANATSSPEERMILLSDIKDLTRVIQHQIAFTKEYQEVGVHLPLWQKVNGVLNRVIPNFKNSGQHILVDLDNVEIYADPLLEKVFYNLVDNAIRYGENITTLKFYFQNSDKGLSIICEDDGAGIPPEEKTRIFERGVGRNTGMGLFLTREILGITGITITENGVFRKGARFEILIPRGTFRFIWKAL